MILKSNFGLTDCRLRLGSAEAEKNAMADEDEIILVDLDDDELVQQMHDDLYDGMQDEIVEGVEILLDRGWTPYDVLTRR